MSKLDLFRRCIRERLTTAALEIFGAVEQTFAQYKEEICRSKEESARLKRLLDFVTPAEIQRHRAEVQQLSLPEPPQIKEEQELWTSQEKEQLQGLKSETTDPRFTEESKFLNVRMSQLNEIRELFGEILTTAAVKMYWAAEKPFAGYQEEISRSKEENMQLQRLLDVVTQPEIKLQRIEMQQLSLPEPPQIKEEQELWTSQEEVQLQGLKSKTTDSIFTSLSVKHNSDQQGSSESSHLHQTVTVEDREGNSLPSNTTEEQINAEPHAQDSAAPEPDRDSQLLSVVVPDCPAALSLEEHGELMLSVETMKKQNKNKNREASSLRLVAFRRTGELQSPDVAQPGTRPLGSHTRKNCHQCQECKRQFALKCTLLKHIRTHTGEKPFQCQECSKSYTRKDTLFSHMRTHTGEKPYECQECGKTFGYKKSLLLHMRIHTSKCPHLCQECKKIFSRKEHLVRHMRTHTGEKPYQCQKCQRCFAHKYNLDSHMRTHTGEKPYECKICNKFFTEKRNILDHERIHAGRKEYQCQECKKRFKVERSLSTHMKKHHGEKSHQC